MYDSNFFKIMESYKSMKNNSMKQFAINESGYHWEDFTDPETGVEGKAQFDPRGDLVDFVSYDDMQPIAHELVKVDIEWDEDDLAENPDLPSTEEIEVAYVEGSHADRDEKCKKIIEDEYGVEPWYVEVTELLNSMGTTDIYKHLREEDEIEKSNDTDGIGKNESFDSASNEEDFDSLDDALTPDVMDDEFALKEKSFGMYLKGISNGRIRLVNFKANAMKFGTEQEAEDFSRNISSYQFEVEKM